MSVALKTSTALPACSACLSRDAPGLRGRDDVNRTQDLDGAASMQRLCVSRDTPGLGGRDDVNRVQDLDGAASMQCVRVSQGTLETMSIALVGAASMQRMRVSRTHLV
jgi:hypothetical protein